MTKRKRNRSLLSMAAGFCCLALLVSACGAKTDPRFYDNASVIKQVEKSKAPDHWPTGDWKTSTPEQQGLNSAALAEWVEGLGNLNLHSFIVIRNGYIVAEGYNSTTDRQTKQQVKSVTKSITSALAGLAVSEKKLAGADETLGDFFPEAAQDATKAHIKLSDLLIMRSGLEWDNTNERSSLEMMSSSNWQQYILDKPVVAEPGTTYNYSNGNAHLVGLAVEKATGERLQDYAVPRLFAPLGISNFGWDTDPQGHSNAAFGLELTSRDMAKIGLLYLQDGEWDGKQVLPKKWVEQTISKGKDRKYTDGTLGGYGYFWFLKKISTEQEEPFDSDMFYAAGSEGQRIFVIPGQNMIVVLTANNTQDDYMPEKQLVSLMRAVEDTKPLAADAAGEARLAQAVSLFKTVKDK
ncbi:serine hydrolase domain-containing protein [Paenibacillus hamazuiensis]|uniref:serine hydrolase domain-containing protein n=1 Tax=Paenibacillus hamazuiensis TaxID=2936508 RepID=UPI00200BF413|nr:serine hydrolase [Paenibacillus hamazuiensis]